MSDCQNKKKCGCQDTALVSQPVCNGANCPDPDLCPETFCDQCVVHCMDTIVDIGINQGDRFDVILQKLALLLTAPQCVDPAGPCNAVLGLQSISIGTTSIQLKWLPNANASAYNLEYKQASAVSWNIMAPITPVVGETVVFATAGGLLPNTEYHFRVLTTCGTDACYSVTILVKTKINS